MQMSMIFKSLKNWINLPPEQRPQPGKREESVRFSFFFLQVIAWLVGGRVWIIGPRHRPYKGPACKHGTPVGWNQKHSIYSSWKRKWHLRVQVDQDWWASAMQVLRNVIRLCKLESFVAHSIPNYVTLSKRFRCLCVISRNLSVKILKSFKQPYWGQLCQYCVTHK